MGADTVSFPALALAAEAADRAEWPEDEEFGLSLRDLAEEGAEVELQVRWVLYRSEGAGILLRVYGATFPTMSAWLEACEL